MSKKLGVQDVPRRRRTAHQVATAGNAIMLRPKPNCTDHRCGDRGDVHYQQQHQQRGGSGAAARAVTDSRQSPGGTSSTLLC